MVGWEQECHLNPLFQQKPQGVQCLGVPTAGPTKVPRNPNEDPPPRLKQQETFAKEKVDGP